MEDLFISQSPYYILFYFLVNLAVSLILYIVIPAIIFHFIKNKTIKNLRITFISTMVVFSIFFGGLLSLSSIIWTIVGYAITKKLYVENNAIKSKKLKLFIAILIFLYSITILLFETALTLFTNSIKYNPLDFLVPLIFVAVSLYIILKNKLTKNKNDKINFSNDQPLQQKMVVKKSQLLKKTEKTDKDISSEPLLVEVVEETVENSKEEKQKKSNKINFGSKAKFALISCIALLIATNAVWYYFYTDSLNKVNELETNISELEKTLQTTTQSAEGTELLYEEVKKDYFLQLSELRNQEDQLWLFSTYIAAPHELTQSEKIKAKSQAQYAVENLSYSPSDFAERFNNKYGKK